MVAISVSNVRYTAGSEPQNVNSGGTRSIEAAIYVTNGDFVDFYSKADRAVGRDFVPRGEIVHSVRKDFILDISKVS